MSKLTDEILAEADTALRGSLVGEPKPRLVAMTHFMNSLERLAHEVTKGNATWDEARSWAQHSADRIWEAREAINDWHAETGDMLYSGGEEGAEPALYRRSQHAFARELFRDTPADEFLAAFDTEDVDQDYREAADRLDLVAPDYIPTSHTWWHWPDT